MRPQADAANSPNAKMHRRRTIDSKARLSTSLNAGRPIADADPIVLGFQASGEREQLGLFEGGAGEQDSLRGRRGSDGHRQTA